MLTESLGKDCPSLNRLSIEAAIEEGLSISKQGLDNRMNERAAVFIRKLLEEQLSCQLQEKASSKLFESFTRVLIKDSTKFDLPAVLADSFPGFGGGASSANACIQYEFDLKSSEITDLDVTAGRKNDVSDASDKKGKIRSKDLIIRDLGYYSLNVLKSITESNAFYLSKLGSKTKVYEVAGEEIRELEMNKLYRMMKKKGISRLEKDVLIGQQEQLPARLVVTSVPDEVREERIRKREKENKKKGYKTSDEYKARAGLNLFVTNVQENELSTEAILQIYRLRWQIELVFKTWKSIFGIHVVHKMKVARFKCILYARLLFICLCWEMLMPFRNRLFNCFGEWLSFDKCFKTLKRYALEFQKVLIKDRDRREEFIRKILRSFVCGHWLEEKKNKTGLEKIMSLKF